jgi:ferric hydroxamate transport system ATP-binding protein
VSGDQGLRGAHLLLKYPGSAAPVVDDASIELRFGAVTALVGPNGSGKSTLLRALARLHTPVSGEIMLAADVPARSLSSKQFARKVTLLGQSRPTPSGVSVRDVVTYGRYPYRGHAFAAGDTDGPRAIAWAMDVTGVTDMAERGVDELSGGERQRVWLASCLAQDTGVLLLDEPTTFLDLRYQVEILDLVRDLADDHHVAVGVVLHDLNQAAAVADRVVLLHEGRVHAVGTPAEVLTEAHLTHAYGIRVDVYTNPLTGRLSTRPVGRHSANRHTADRRPITIEG